MPTYDYQCDACNHTFEEWQSFKDDELTKCPQCKKKKLRRLLGGGAAIIFKGSGFYETDYRSSNYQESAKKDADTAKASTEAKTDAKPEAKTETKPEAQADTPTVPPPPPPTKPSKKSSKGS